MTSRGDAAQSIAADAPGELFRWECRCQATPVLLATYDARGRIHIKVRDRYWHVQGTVQTVCPRCGSEHALDLVSREVAESRSQRVEAEFAQQGTDSRRAKRRRDSCS